MKPMIPSGTFLVAVAVVVCKLSASAAEPLYFPGDDPNWQRVAADQIGWDDTRLNAALAVAGERQSSAVVILHRGRILAERYWDPAEMPRMYQAMLRGRDDRGHPIEDVASVQKGIVAVLIGIAQQRGLLGLDDPVNKYLGSGWSRATAEQERAIDVRQLITMTSGLANDLGYEAQPGTRWRYNTAAYHLLMEIVCAATGQDRDQITQQWLTGPLHMSNSKWIRRPGGKRAFFGFASTARDLARFGLMVQADGRWQDRQIVSDKAYLRDMLSPSQDLNRGYGYLWWLNRPQALGPGLVRRRRNGRMIPTAPADLVAMQGALDRKVYVVPSLELVVVRLGAGGQSSGISFNDAFWEALIDAAP